MSFTGKQSLLVDTLVPTHKPFVDALFKSTGMNMQERAANHSEVLRLNELHPNLRGIIVARQSGRWL